MYPNEYQEFVKLMTDLCISTNRPCGDDLVRVFWEDLKHVPFAMIQRQAAQLRAKGQTKFNSNDLRPPPEDRVHIGGPDNHQIMERFHAHLMRGLWNSLSPLQRLFKHEWVFAGDRNAPRCVALRIHPDRVEMTIENRVIEYEYPGHYIRVEDCDLDPSPSSPTERTPSQVAAEWNEADAVRDVLNRK